MSRPPVFHFLLRLRSSSSFLSEDLEEICEITRKTQLTDITQDASDSHSRHGHLLSLDDRRDHHPGRGLHG